MPHIQGLARDEVLLFPPALDDYITADNPVRCKEFDLFGGELIAIDGSKFKAVNNRKRNFTDEKLATALRHMEEQIAAYLHALDVGDSDRETAAQPRVTATELQERSAQLRARTQQYQELRQVLAASGEHQISLTDPDSRAIPVTQGVDICYNVELAVDAKHKLIVAHDVTTNITDHHQLAPLATQAKAVLGVEELNAVADKGFYNGEQVKACDLVHITAYVPKPHTSRNQHKGLFTKNDFRYDSTRDSYWCPQGEELTFRFETEEKGRATRYYATPAYGTCPIRAAHVAAYRSLRRVLTPRWPTFARPAINPGSRSAHSVPAHCSTTPLADEVRATILAISPATADRILSPIRRDPALRGISTTRVGTLLKHQIPVRTFTDWDDAQPGFFEIDLVAHCGGNAEGAYLYTLVLTDVATG